jgi:hypothetical protein
VNHFHRETVTTAIKQTKNKEERKHRSPGFGDFCSESRSRRGTWSPRPQSRDGFSEAVERLLHGVAAADQKPRHHLRVPLPARLLELAPGVGAQHVAPRHAAVVGPLEEPRGPEDVPVQGQRLPPGARQPPPRLGPPPSHRRGATRTWRSS